LVLLLSYSQSMSADEYRKTMSMLQENSGLSYSTIVSVSKIGPNWELASGKSTPSGMPIQWCVSSF